MRVLECNRSRARIATACLLLATTAVQAARIEEVRTGETDERTRIVIESDQPIRFTLYSVRYPDRFLLDLEGIANSGPLNAIESLIASNHRSIRAIRTLEPAPGTTTLELVLRGKQEPQIFALEPANGRGHRLVLDIYAPGKVTGQRARADAGAPAVAAAASPPPEPQPTGVATPQAQPHAARASARSPTPAADPAPHTARASPPLASTPAAAPITPDPASTATAGTTAPAAAAAPTPGALGAREATVSPPEDIEEAWIAVHVNGQPAADAVLALQRGDRRWLLPREELEKLRLRAPAGAPIMHGGAAYHPLDAYRGLSYHLDDRSQTLHIEAGPGLFAGTLLGQQAPGFAAPPPAPTGGLVNYDVVASGSEGEEHLSGMVEVVGFGAWGVLESSFAGRDLLDDGDVLRLETTWTRDVPGRMASLRVGDTVTGSGSIGRPVRIGGIQWATNFATQPDFIRFPLPGLAGEAALPSIVELYVDNALRSRHEVPIGPFSIDQLPVVTGGGVAQVIVRDLLGRERVITQAFYVSPRLLQPGLDEYSYELGAVRENFGLRSNDYGRAALVGTHRRGITERLTAEVHGEFLADQQMLGAGAALLWPEVGVLSLYAAASDGALGSGTLVGAGFERQGRTLGIGVSGELASRHYTQLGLDAELMAPRLATRAYASLNLGSAGSVALSYALQDRRSAEDLANASLHYGLRLGDFGFLNLAATRVLAEEADTIVSANLSVPLGERRHASVSLAHEDGALRHQAVLQRNPPVGEGQGYRLLAEEGAIDRIEASMQMHTDTGAYLLELGRLGDMTGWRASAQGGVAWLGRSLHVGRQITDSFAIVQLPGYPNVGVYADNQLITRTDAEGNALVPALRPYEINRLRIEQANLPLDVDVGALALEAVPWYRSGLLLRFPVRRARGAVLQVVKEDGSFVSPGAVAQIEGRDETHPVGYDGLLYVTGAEGEMRIMVQWGQQTCTVSVRVAESAEPLLDLGRQVCTETP